MDALELPPHVMQSQVNSPLIAHLVGVGAGAVAATVDDIGLFRGGSICGAGTLVTLVQAGFTAKARFRLCVERWGRDHALQIAATGAATDTKGRTACLGGHLLALGRIRGVVDHGFGDQSYSLRATIACRSVGFFIVTVNEKDCVY